MSTPFKFYPFPTASHYTYYEVWINNINCVKSVTRIVKQAKGIACDSKKHTKDTNGYHYLIIGSVLSILLSENQQQGIHTLFEIWDMRALKAKRDHQTSVKTGKKINHKNQ